MLKGCPWGWARLIDVRDPAQPREVSELKVAPWNHADRCGEVSVPQHQGASFSSHNPTLTPHLGLITWHSAGLRAFDLGDPAEARPAAEFMPEPLPAVVSEDPVLSSYEKTVMWSYPIVKDGLIYVVDLRNGLYVLRYRGPYAPSCAAGRSSRATRTSAGRFPAAGYGYGSRSAAASGPASAGPTPRKCVGALPPQATQAHGSSYSTTGRRCGCPVGSNAAGAPGASGGA